MAQNTLVLVVPPSARTSLKHKLEAGNFEFRSVPHALISVKGDGVVATLYASGKFVVQGPDPEMFVARYVEAGTPAARSKKSGSSSGSSSSEGSPGSPGSTGSPGKTTGVRAARTVTLIGSDECGKGDYFGPLVVAGVRATPEEQEELAGSAVADSKKIADPRIMVLGAALRQRYTYAIARLDPPAYNARYAQGGKLNEILGELHVKVIRELAKSPPQPDEKPGLDVLVDQFANRRLLEKMLSGEDLTLEQRPRAEENPVVAAASVIARQEFLIAMQELSSECGIDLCKGAGAPTDTAGQRYCQMHGFDELERVAKMHFKNTEKIRSRLPS
jgi:ribonuclease HIII